MIDLFIVSSIIYFVHISFLIAPLITKGDVKFVLILKAIVYKTYSIIFNYDFL